MYRLDKRVTLDATDTLEQADQKINDFIKTLHLTICKINTQQTLSKDAIEALRDTRKSSHAEFKQDRTLSALTRGELLKATECARELTEDEVDSLRSALDLIQNIRTLREERRVLAKEARSTRRGVLIAQLQSAAKNTPLWIGKSGEEKPPLCGASQPPANHVIQAGDRVAAKVEENWILAEFISYEGSQQVAVEDIDAVDSSKAVITLHKRKVVPLPHWRANPLTQEELLHKEGCHVMALYPQTTCFYKGVVAASPETPSEDYIVLFEDSTYPSGFSPPMPVAQKYIVELPEDKPSNSNSKRKDVKNATRTKGKGQNQKGSTSKNQKRKR